MGTDIHAFIEFSLDRKVEAFSALDDVRALNAGEFFVSRNYDLFDALGDGRSRGVQPPDARPRRALHPPRGIPLVLSESVFRRYYVAVLRDGEAPGRVEDGGLDVPVETASPADAERWLAEGLSHPGPAEQRWVHWETGPDDKLRKVLNARPRGRLLVSNPNWHTPSWLLLAEIRAALRHASLELSELSPDFQLIVSAMSQLEHAYGHARTRLVFWFDN